MRTKALLTIIAALASVLSPMGLIATVKADPGNSDQLNLGGRTFAIQGEYLAALPGLPFEAGDTFVNCYTFEEDGVWIDPLFLEGFVIPGTWEQYSAPKARTDYRAIADGTGTVGLLLIQHGTVAPGRGSKQLEALTTILIPGAGNLVLATVRSIGTEVDVCPY